MSQLATAVWVNGGGVQVPQTSMRGRDSNHGRQAAEAETGGRKLANTNVLRLNTVNVSRFHDKKKKKLQGSFHEEAPKVHWKSASEIRPFPL